MCVLNETPPNEYRIWFPVASCSGSVWARWGRPRWSGCSRRCYRRAGKAAKGAPAGTNSRLRPPQSPETPLCPDDPPTHCCSPPSDDCSWGENTHGCSISLFTPTVRQDSGDLRTDWWSPEFPSQQIVDDVRVCLDQTHQDLLLQLRRNLEGHTLQR